MALQGNQATRAVIFALYGTLMAFPVAEFDATLTAMAGDLGIADGAFRAAWSAIYPAFESGAAPTIESALAELGHRTGHAPGMAGVPGAADRWRAFQRESFRPREDAVTTITRLRCDGYRTGLISNAPPEVPSLWQASDLAQLFDVAVFSCAVRLRKPDPAIYQFACRQLGVPAGACWYVGDGGSRELSGARETGMRVVQLDVFAEDPAEARRLEREPWSGRRMASLAELVVLVAGDSSSA